MGTRGFFGTVVVALALGAGACGIGGAQSSPGAVLEATYEAIHEGEFGRACELIDESPKRALAVWRSSCEAALASEYDKDERASFVSPKVVAEALDRSADVVLIPEDAVTFDGVPSKDGDTTVVLRDGKWWITLG